MNILAIETSCDETAICLMKAEGDFDHTRFSILGNALYSQASKHAEYGGVYPSLAKREHARNLVPILAQALTEAGMLVYRSEPEAINAGFMMGAHQLLSREPELFGAVMELLPRIERPNIDAIAVTIGPGLEPALWVGINFAKLLAALWQVPIVPVNHMEGHLMASLVAERRGPDADERRSAVETSYTIASPNFPVLGLLISGGHTELVLMHGWFTYELLGSTRDDAVGECFDKVARMLELPYPGGPQISKLAMEAREQGIESPVHFPRPMLRDNSLDFSFSGLKTAALYAIRDAGKITDEIRLQMARELEDAITETLIGKTRRALTETGAQAFVIGGGVSANDEIRRAAGAMVAAEFPHVEFRVPSRDLTTDNAVMIALAGYYRLLRGDIADDPTLLRAKGNLPLEGEAN